MGRFLGGETKASAMDRMQDSGKIAATKNEVEARDAVSWAAREEREDEAWASSSKSD